MTDLVATYDGQGYECCMIEQWLYCGQTSLGDVVRPTTQFVQGKLLCKALKFVE